MLAVMVAIAVSIRLTFELLEPVWPWLLGAFVVLALVWLGRWWRGRW
jgi:hypothetical protein